MDFDSVLLAKKLSGGGGGGSAVLINKNISSNGTYNASSDSADGYKKVVVSVPNTYVAGDEGKVVSNGALVSQTSETYTTNNTYDTTLINSVTVNVSGGEWTSDGIASGTEPNGAITLSNSVTSIVEKAFMKKTAITSVSGSNVTSVGNDAFIECSSLASISFPSLTTVGNGSFRSCKLVSISLPNVTTCGTNSFQQNINTLTTLSLPSMTASGNNLAYDCEKLETVDISSLLTIPSQTFQQCYSLEVLDCPSVTKINSSAFYNARKLSTLVLRSQNVVTLDNVNAFTNTAITGYNSGSGTIYVPSSLVSSYQTASNWSNIYGQGHVTFSAIEGSIYE